MRTGSFERNYYNNDEPDLSENNIKISDEEPDMPDIEDFLAEISSDESSNDSDSKVNTNTYNSDLSYIYYMFSGYQDPHININIYHKQTELEKDSLNVTLIQIIIFLESKYKLKKANSIRLLVSLA